MQESEAKRFCFALTLLPPADVKVSESGIKQQKSMVPISMAGIKKKTWLKSLCVMSNIKVLAAQDGQPGERNTLHRSICYSYG